VSSAIENCDQERRLSATLHVEAAADGGILPAPEQSVLVDDIGSPAAMPASAANGCVPGFPCRRASHVKEAYNGRRDRTPSQLPLTAARQLLL
jgi:hypothetical protein